jgi:hypothetical protein
MDEFNDWSSYMWSDFGPDYIVPPILEGPSSSPRSSAETYETPWYVNTINKAIDAATSAYVLGERGYPTYPTPNVQQPIQTINPQTGLPIPQVAPQQGAGINLSNTTLMLIVGGALLFMLGKRGR